MKKVQIIDNENFEKYADYDNCDVWLLNRITDRELNPKTKVVEDVVYSYLPNTEKVPKLMTELYRNYPAEKTTVIVERKVLDEKGMVILGKDGITPKIEKVETVSETPGFEYEIITNDMYRFEIRTLICDSRKIKVFKD